MKKHSWILIVAFFAFVGVILVAYGVTTPSDWSKTENRELVQFPHAGDYAGAPDGYAQALEQYLGDQFPYREHLISAYTAFQERTGRWYVRDVRVMKNTDMTDDSDYLISDDYLFLDSYPVTEAEQCAYRVALTRLCAKSGLPVVDMIFPYKNYALAEGTGGLFTGEIDAQNLSARLNAAETAGAVAIDVCTPFLASYDIREREQMYFKTDIHWNPLGAFRCAKIAAQELANAGLIAESSVPQDDGFVWKDLSENHTFEGDLARRFDSKQNVAEFIPVYWAEQAEARTYQIDADRHPTAREGIIASGVSDKVLDYSKIGSYNLLYLHVENPDAPEQRNVLILKDSYQCATLEYFTSIFQSVTVLDPRFDIPPLHTVIEEESIDCLILMFHQNNLLEEVSAYIDASYGA